MRIKRILILLLVIPCISNHAQELFILNEPASNVPKGVIGVRMFSQNFKEVNTNRSLLAFRLMYGVTPRFSVYVTVSGSNHHNKQLPADLITHTHNGNQTYYFTHNIKRGVNYPFLFNGVNLYAKYRFISIDKKNEHLRLALYGEWSKLNTAHDEAEPNLLDDTGGYGGGIIVTWLKNRFASSVTTGFIRPDSYSEVQPDFTGGPDLPTYIKYGNAIRYNLSMGYRIWPKHYIDYDQPNLNVYVEFQGKKYDASEVVQNGVLIETEAVALVGNNYIEMHPGIQYIVKSNLRLEASVGFGFINRSYVHFTPLWTFALQRYFYRK
jgi:hypothetical protein